MSLQGKAQIDLLRKGKVVHREVQKNTVTTYTQNLIGKGNFHNLVTSAKIMPLYQNFFSGCLLTDVTNDATTCMLASNATVLAQASNDSYAGTTNTRRGNYNAIESGAITGGYKFVWEWDTSKANSGTAINSVCLTRPQIARADFSTTVVTESDSYLNDNLASSATITADSSLANLNVIDYENDIGYKIDYDSGTITIITYTLSTKSLHLVTPLYTAIEGTTYTISQTVNNYSQTSSCISFDRTQSVIHLLTWTGGTLEDYAIATNDLTTCTYSTHTFSDVTFAPTPSYRSIRLERDAFPVINGQFWAMMANGTKIIKLDMTNDVVLAEYDNPVYSIGSASTSDNKLNGASLILKNGDWYKFINKESGVQPCTYYHNGTFYYAKQNGLALDNSSAQVGFEANDYGTVLATYENTWGSYIGLTSVFPSVSTVANLANPVTKTAGLTMKLTYSITEQ